MRFTASAGGGLFPICGDHAHRADGDRFSNSCSLYTVFDLTTGQSGNCLQPQVSGGNSVALTLNSVTVNPGDDVEIVALNTTNPPSGDFDATSVATTSDSAAAGTGRCR